MASLEARDYLRWIGCGGHCEPRQRVHALLLKTTWSFGGGGTKMGTANLTEPKGPNN